jgi:uncharacterized protein (TIGR02186 family)
MFRFIILFLAFAFPVHAEEIVADMSQSNVGISATFDGSDILIFGAISRNAPISSDGETQIILTVAGPSLPVSVRRKDKKLGLIWVNNESVLIDDAPSFYSISTSAPLDGILSDRDDMGYKVSIPRAIESIGAQIASGHAAEFTGALIRIRTNNGLYSIHEGNVNLISDTLFSASVDLPSNLTAGNYTARILLVRDQIVIDEFETAIDIHKVGIERWLYNLAHENALYYGLMSLFIAIAAGWTASAVFSYFKS